MRKPTPSKPAKNRGSTAHPLCPTTPSHTYLQDSRKNCLQNQIVGPNRGAAEIITDYRDFRHPGVLSKLFLAVYQNRNRPVIDEFNLHHCPEDSSLNLAKIPSRFLDKTTIQRFSLLGRCRLAPGRPPAASHI